CDRDRQRVLPLPPWRGRGARVARVTAPVRQQRPARAGERAAAGARAAGDSDGNVPGGDHRGDRTRQEAPGSERAVRAAVRAWECEGRLRGLARRGAGGGGGAAGMSGRRYRVEVMHGVNLDQLGRRDPLLYGTLTLPELERQIEGHARELGLEARFFHTNHEGTFVERLHA